MEEKKEKDTRDDQPMSREEQLEAELANIRQQMAEIQETVQHYSPEELAKCIALSMEFLKMVDDSRRLMKKVSAPASFLKDTQKQVHEVSEKIMEMPQQLRTAVKNKAYSTITKAIQGLSGMLTQGIDFLAKQQRAAEKKLGIAESHIENTVVMFDKPMPLAEAEVALDAALKAADKPVKAAPVKKTEATKKPATKAKAKKKKKEQSMGR